MTKPLPKEIWRHFKGQTYMIVTVAKHSETQDELVVYRKWDENDPMRAIIGSHNAPWARPLDMFLEPATVKPTKGAESNCQHPPESHDTETIGSAEFTMCRECQTHAEKGRFLRIMRGDGTIPPEAQ